MKNTHTNLDNRLRVRNRFLLLLAMIFGLGLSAPLVKAAAGDKGDRKPVLPHLAFSDIDNEGPVTRDGQRLKVEVERHRRDAILNWRGPIRLDLILPVRLMPGSSPPRR